MSVKNKKVLIVTCNSAGSGHFRVSEAIKAVLKDKVKVKAVDLSKNTSKFFDFIIRSYHFLILYFPFFYWVMYKLSEISFVDKFVNVLFYSIGERKYAEVYEKEKPDLVINVHSYTGRGFLEYLCSKKIKVPIWNIITDPITFHRSWMDPRYDLNIVSTEEAYKKAVKFAPASKVIIGGSVIHPSFYSKLPKKKNLKLKYGLHQDKPVILISGGGEGAGYSRKTIALLLKKGINAEIIAVCGRNKKLYNTLKAYPIHTVGFTSSMHEYLGMADILVGKAGPGTVAEALLLGVPMLITGYVYGQERGNVDYIVKNRVGFFTKDPEKALDIITNFLRCKLKLNKGSEYRLDKNFIFKLREMVLDELYLDK